MTVFLLTLVFVLVFFCAMAVGVLFGRKPLKGSCGGISALGMDTACDICGGNPDKCEEQAQSAVAERSRELGYDAMAERERPINRLPANGSARRS